MDSEVWLDVAGTPYQVSSSGRVRNGAGRILKPRRHTNGYLRVSLGAKREEYVHRLVAVAFIGPAPDGCHLDHIDHVRDNNSARNLRWLTPTENRARRRVRRGESHTHAKLTAAMVAEIRRVNSPSMDVTFAAMAGCSRESVRDARIRKTWTQGESQNA